MSPRGGVRRSAVHNTPLGDAPAIDAGTDTLTTNCITDEFAGTALDAHWSTLVGALPTYNVDASRLFISDAPFADTPSMPDRSWIYTLDTDKGNQIARGRPPSNDRGYGRAVSGGERCEGARPSRRATDPGGVA